MRDSPPKFVVDANVLIDLHVGGVLDQFFNAGWQIVAPDVIVEELDTPDGKELVRKGLKSQPLPPQWVSEVHRLREQYRKPSTNDLFALVLAKRLGVTLLTGDLDLRKAAQAEDVPFHGTLWVLERMVDKGVLSKEEAAKALHRMQKERRRLPKAECERLLKKWGFKLTK